MKPTKPTYLLTGVHGILGTELEENPFMDFIPVSRAFCDITDDDSVMYFDDCVNKDISRGIIHGIVHCAAFTDVPGAEKKRKEAIATNVRGTENMATVCHMYGGRFVYISTDYVYPGETGNYSEEDVTRPVNFYAMTKLMGEAYADGDSDLIIRTSFKPNCPWPYAKAFDDLFTSADYVDVIAPKIVDLIANMETGVYNVGTERKSIYELARRRNTTVEPMSRKDIKNVFLPADVSMNLKKYNDYYNSQYGCDAPDCCP